MFRLVCYLVRELGASLLPVWVALAAFSVGALGGERVAWFAVWGLALAASLALVALVVAIVRDALTEARARCWLRSALRVSHTRELDARYRRGCSL